MEQKFCAILYKVILYCRKNLFERLATFAFAGAEFNICTIVLSSQPSAPQVPAAIPAKRQRHLFESDDENEMKF